MQKVIVGLGNPGKTYEDTYHNAGALAVDAFVKSRASSHAGKGAAVEWKKYKESFEYLELGDIVFVKPLTFMNDSGKAMREAMKKYNAKPENLFVAHDDSDITVGNYKISFARNSAGHKGVQSIIDSLKTKAFTRIRIGIRPAREKQRQKAGEFALKEISKSNRAAFTKIFAEIAGSEIFTE